MKPDPSWKDRVIRLSGDWLDGRDGEHPPGPPAEASSNAEEAEHYLADLLLVDALLASMSNGAAEEREERIRRVMLALDAPQPASRPRARLLRWSPILALAAGLLLVVMGSWIEFARKSLADEVLAAVDEVSSEAIDRVYAFRRLRLPSVEGGTPQGRLYLRGRRGFVITCDEAVLGRDGDQFWVVVPPREVILSDDFRWIDARATQDEVGLRFMQELSLESRHIPLMQLASVAELMRHDYDVALSRVELGNRAADLLVGRRRSARSELPATIRLWSDLDSRIIRRAEIEWGPGNALVLELLPAEPVPEGWYGYRAHCRGEPTVSRAPGKP